ncbi:MAG: DUF2520 domain-containing protein [Defluviitaleaceae bacterium]|nr:DUF2520 domain-containing protein [Defluviitaleaceae bacterium]
MKKCIIGCGKVGTALGSYLGITPTKNIEETKNANIIFIATPDSKIKEVYEQIKTYLANNHISKGSLEANFPLVPTLSDGSFSDGIASIASGKIIFCHMSGFLASDLFKDNIGFSIHPMAAVTKETDLKKIMFTIEGDSKHIHIIKELFPNNQIIKKEAKPLYHAAAVIASNFLVGIYNIAENVLKEAGIQNTEMLMGLVETTINNIKSKGSINALTGPIERGDLETVKSHLEALPENYKDIYNVMSNQLIKIAIQKNIDK